MNPGINVKFASAGLLAAALALPAWAGQLQAGAARVSITPTADEFPFTAPREKPYVGVHDDVYVRALVVDDGSQHRVAIVVVDASIVPEADKALSAAAHAAGVPESHVLLAASHSHNTLIAFYHGGEPAPVHRREMDRIGQAIVTATAQAAAHLQPARMAFGRGQAFVNINNGEAAGLTSWNDPHGPSDKSLDVVRFAALDGKPIAVLVNYASHAEVMFRSVTRDGGYEVSGDLPGAVARKLEAADAAAPVVLYTAAAEADQLPLFKSLEPAAHLPGVDEGAGGWALLDVQARRLADGVLEVIASMPRIAASGTVAAAADTVVCPGKRRAMPTEPDNGRPVPPVVVPIRILRLGDLQLDGIGGDISSSIGVHIKNSAAAQQTTVVTDMAGMVGYLLADSAYLHPGHGVQGSQLAPGCIENALVDGFKKLEERIK